MIPKIDSEIGIELYSTSFAGCGGKIKVKENDFQVSEKLSPKAKSMIKEDAGYAVYLLTKQGIDTFHSLQDIANKTGIRLKSLGLKDSNAITEQFIIGINQTKSLEKLDSKKYSIKRIGFVKKPLSKKDMTGNHFKITISDPESKISEFNEQDKILNFFGYQRFGSNRPVNHQVGKSIIQGDYEKAVSLIVSFTTKYETPVNFELRTKLQDKANYASLLSDMPKGMDLERTLVQEILDHNDSKKALRALPISMRRFFVQAYQSYLYNKTLSKSFDFGEDMFSPQEGDVCFDDKGKIGKFVKGMDQRLAVPLVGYSYYKKTRFHYQISKILEEEEISPKAFFIKDLQEASAEGGFRNASVNCQDFCHSENQVSFLLSRGSYATIVLREIMKPKDPLLAGF